MKKSFFTSIINCLFITLLLGFFINATPDIHQKHIMTTAFEKKDYNY